MVANNCKTKKFGANTSRALCTHIPQITENVTYSSCIAISATKNGYNNLTIASENFTGKQNRSEKSDTSHTDTSRVINRVSVFGEKGMKNLLRRC